MCLGDKTISIIAEIKRHFNRELLIQRKVIITTNLEKTLVCGVLSKGMILAAKMDKKRNGGEDNRCISEESVTLVRVGEDAEIGAKCFIKVGSCAVTKGNSSNGKGALLKRGDRIRGGEDGGQKKEFKWHVPIKEFDRIGFVSKGGRLYVEGKGLMVEGDGEVLVDAPDGSVISLI